MSIRGIPPPVRGYSERLISTGGRMPFELVDTSRNGKVSLKEITNAVRLNFPGLTDMECSAIATKAFDATAKGGKVNANGWRSAEKIVLNEANISLADKERDAAATPARPTWGPPAAELNGPQTTFDGPAQRPGGYVQQPAQYPQQPQYGGYPAQTRYGAPPVPQYPGINPNGMTPIDPLQKDAMKAAGRTGVGLLKMIPVVGNILNGIDFIKDIGKTIGSWFNPNKSLGEKLKATSDMLFHGIGTIAPQVGGIYDVAQGLARLNKNGEVTQQMQQQLPPWQMDQGGFPQQYPMQYGNQPPMQQPYTQGPTFDMQGNYVPGAINPYAQPGMQQYLPPYQQPYQDRPYFDQLNQYQPAPQQPESIDARAGKAVARAGVGALKMIPVVGNVLNAVDFVRDIGKVAMSWLNPNKTLGDKLKAGSDLLFHGAGMIVPQIGGGYDMVQGAVRYGSATADSFKQYMSGLPPYQFDPGRYPPQYPMQYAY